MTIRVVLIDDHPAVRAGIREALDRAAGIDVVGEAATGEEGLQLIDQLQPDVAVLDCRLPDLAGAEVAARVREREIPTRVLALSAHAGDRYVRAMLQAGTSGYLLKDEALETVVAAVEAVARREGWYSQQVMGKVAAWARGGTLLPDGADALTEREIEVLRLMGRGWDNGRIAAELVISEGTVKNHVTSIYGKLGVHSRAEAVAWAWQQNLMG